MRYVGANTLPSGVQFSATDPDTVWFAAFGPALTGSATYVLEYGGETRSVQLTAAGFAFVATAQ